MCNSQYMGKNRLQVQNPTTTKMVMENPEPGFVKTVLNGSQKIVLDHYN